MSELKEKNSINENQNVQSAEARHWFTDVEKLFAVFAAVICGYIALTIKNAEPFLTFASRHPYINDMLHDHIFRDYLALVEVYVPKVVPYLLLAVIVLFIASFIMDYKKSEHGYVLRIAGLLMASLTGLGYILVYVIYGFAEPVMNAKFYVFLSLIAVGVVLAIISCFYYGKKKKGICAPNVVLTCIATACVLGCFIGAGVYLAKNLAADYKVCYDVNQLLKEHSNGINQDIAYQIGNVEKREATWHDGVMYYTTGKAIWKIDGSGTVEKVYSMPGDGEFYAYGIYYYEGYLYVGCYDYNNEAKSSVLQVSVADGSAKEVCSLTSNRKFFGVVDGKLLYTTATEEEYVADVYCIDLKGNIDEKEAVLYDKGVNSLTGLDREIWLQKYLYTYLDYTYWRPNVDYQFIGENVYYLYDLKNDPDEPHDYGGEYPYSYDGDCTLILDKADVATEYLLEQVVDFNIFNNTIYYMQENKAGYDIYSCDKDGGNRTLLASVPVAFEESDHGCSTNMAVGEGFIVCEVYAEYLGRTYTYFVDIETGEVKEIEFL